MPLLPSPTRLLRHGDVSVELPSGWSDGSQVIAVGPEEGWFRPNLVVSAPREFPVGNAVEFAKAVADEVAAGLLRYTLLREAPARFGNLKGFLREHTFELQGVRVMQLQWYVVADGLAWVFTFTHREDRMASNRRVAEALFAGIKLGEAKLGYGIAGSARTVIPG